ncbi:MAG: methyltransferase domain-containing protein [Candidatus Woesearchaeota archaeon]
MFIFSFSGENPSLAVAEAISIVKPKKHELDNNLLLSDSISGYERLAFTRAVYQVLFSATTTKGILQQASSFNWQQYYEGSFAVRIKGVDIAEKDFASIVWKNLKNPEVDLEKPKTPIAVIAGKKLYCCLLIAELKHSFSNRKPDLRPGFAPVSLNPKLARAMVNLTGSNTSILDPFCGTGGVLIEAALMGLKAEGSDISKEMLEKAGTNLSYYKLKAKLQQKDALKLSRKVPYVVSDLPYGQSSHVEPGLYKDFFKTLNKILAKKAVVALPYFSSSLLKGTKLRLEGHFKFYIHKSMTKHIIVLGKKTL